MVKVASACLAALSVCLPFAARAEPITDTAVWTQHFVQDALKGDVDGMGALVEEAAAPGLDTAAIKATIQLAVRATKSQQAESAEAFGEVNVGSFIKRINVAVIFEKNYLFYSFALGRHGERWMIYNFKVDGNINNILNAPWPG